MDIKTNKNTNKEEEYSPDLKTWKAEARENYGGLYQSSALTVPVYTKTQMRSIYPNGKYQTVAEYSPKSKKRQTEMLIYDETALPLYRYGTNSRIVYEEKGFLAVDKGADHFVVLLGNAVLKRAVFLVLCLAVITGVVFIIARGHSAGNGIPAPVSSSAVSVELESNAVDWQGIKVSEPQNASADGIRIPGYKSITIQADTKEVSVNLQNPEKNNCYFVIRLVLLDTQEKLYESKMIEPGKGLYTITLTRALAAGTYPAQLQYEPYDLTTLTRLNGAVINLSLIAE